MAVTAFLEVDFGMILLLPVSAFLFFNASQPLTRLFADLCAMMVLFALLGYITARLTQHKPKKEKE